MQEHPNSTRCLRVTAFGNAITPLPIAKPTLLLGVTDIEDNLIQEKLQIFPWISHSLI